MHGVIPPFSLTPEELEAAQAFWKKEFSLGNWTAFRCGIGFYLILYTKEDKTGIVTGTGSAINYDLVLPYTHRLVRAFVLKNGTDADTTQIRLTPPRLDAETYYEILLDTSAGTNRSLSWLADPPENYEMLPDTRLRFNVNLTNTKKAVIGCVVQFLEVPA